MKQINRIKFLLSFLFIATSGAYAQSSYQDLVGQADSLYQAKEYQKSADVYARALKIEQKNKADIYNAACTFALAGWQEPAVELLNSVINKGWDNYEHLKKDGDLNGLHATPSWQKLMVKVDLLEKRQQAGYNQPVKRELEAILQSDQGIRNQYIAAQKQFGYNSPEVNSLTKIMIHDDSVNLVKVSRILDQYGWLGRNKVGPAGNSTLFLVIQHADLKTQQKYLPLMRSAVKKGDAIAGNLALLEDRISLREGRKQIYGSQIGSNADGTSYVLPLDDPDQVDVRRASVGLEPLKDYVRIWGIIWNVETYKKQLPEIEKR